MLATWKESRTPEVLASCRNSVGSALQTYTVVSDHETRLHVVSSARTSLSGDDMYVWEACEALL